MPSLYHEPVGRGLIIWNLDQNLRKSSDSAVWGDSSYMVDGF